MGDVYVLRALLPRTQAMMNGSTDKPCFQCGENYDGLGFYCSEECRDAGAVKAALSGCSVPECGRNDGLGKYCSDACRNGATE